MENARAMTTGETKNVLTAQGNNTIALFFSCYCGISFVSRFQQKNHVPVIVEFTTLYILVKYSSHQVSV